MNASPQTEANAPAAATPSIPPVDPRPMDRAQRRNVRRLAMQVLYWIDVTGEGDERTLGQGLDQEYDSEEIRRRGLALALAAWSNHAWADAMVAELTPSWPTHRQPPVDRALFRLALHEMTSGRIPVKVAINEAVELAKQFAAEQSPAFINAVLDKAARRLKHEPEALGVGS